jgi:hypothetical protein
MHVLCESDTVVMDEIQYVKMNARYYLQKLIHRKNHVHLLQWRVLRECGVCERVERDLFVEVAVVVAALAI